MELLIMAGFIIGLLVGLAMALIRISDLRSQNAFLDENLTKTSNLAKEFEESIKSNSLKIQELNATNKHLKETLEKEQSVIIELEDQKLALKKALEEELRKPKYVVKMKSKKVTKKKTAKKKK